MIILIVLHENTSHTKSYKQMLDHVSVVWSQLRRMLFWVVVMVTVDRGHQWSVHQKNVLSNFVGDAYQVIRGIDSRKECYLR